MEVVPVYGQPDPDRICTSIVERSNLSLRMGVRRFTRLTNAFSKKWENHAAMIMLSYAYYNFCRIHKSLRVTPAMEAGIADHGVGDFGVAGVTNAPFRHYPGLCPDGAMRVPQRLTGLG